MRNEARVACGLAGGRLRTTRVTQSTRVAALVCLAALLFLCMAESIHTLPVGHGRHSCTCDHSFVLSKAGSDGGHRCVACELMFSHSGVASLCPGCEIEMACRCVSANIKSRVIAFDRDASTESPRGPPLA